MFLVETGESRAPSHQTLIQLLDARGALAIEFDEKVLVGVSTGAARSLV